MASDPEGVEYGDQVETSYGALRLIATILQALAWVALTVGAIGSVVLVVSLAAETDNVGLLILAFVGGIFLTVFQAIILFALSDLISVFLDIESNTWDAAENTLSLLEAEGKERRVSRTRRR